MKTLIRHVNAASEQPGHAVVADTYRLAGSVVACPAAPLVSGELRRRGITTVDGHLDLGAGELVASVPVTADVALAVAADEQVRAVADEALGAWLSVARSRTVLLASPRGFCAGVERAIEIVERVLSQRVKPVYVHKQIVHNKHVVGRLERKGATFVTELDEVPDGATVVFSAHGVSPAVREEATRRGLEAIDGTCPLVTKVHTESRRFAARGDTIILIGQKGHEEVEGTFGEAPARTVVIESASDVDRLRVEDPAKVSFLTQTTLAVDETTEVVDALRAKFPELRGPTSEDICYATTNRQDAVRAVAARADVQFVVGSTNSANSVHLVELAERIGTPAHLVDDVTGIRPEWLADASVVGLTSGASAPPDLVEGIVAAIGGLGPVTVEEHRTTTETIQFGLPSVVREPR